MDPADPSTEVAKLDARRRSDEEITRSYESADAWSTTAPTTDLVRFVCVSGPHQELGPTQPDGAGHLSLVRRAWAYCAAGRGAEPHSWAEIMPRALVDIRHADIPELAAET